MRMGSGEGSTTRSFIVYTVHLICSMRLSLEDSDEQAMKPEWNKIDFSKFISYSYRKVTFRKA
jgi:hypothetical protein